MILRRILTMVGRPGALAICVWLTLLASGCATTGKDLDDTRLAWVNGESVTVLDLQEGFETSHRGHTTLLAGAGAIREFLEKTIDRRLLVQEAQRIGLDGDPGIRRAVDTRTAELARELLYKDEVAQPQDITDKAIQEAYDKMAQRYRVRHILTYTREDADRATARVRGGEAFGIVAAEVSVAATAGKGGDLGFITWGQLDPLLDEVMEGMQPGDLRGPIETDQGWNVLLLEERRPWTERSDEAKQKSRIKMTLSRRAMLQRSREYYDELRKRWGVQVFEQTLSQKAFFGTDTGGPDAGQAKQIVVAKAGADTISLADLRARLNLEALRQHPWPFALKRIREILDETIFASLLKQEALRRGYAKKLEVVREAHKLENALLLGRLLGTVILPRVQVTDGDVRAFYDQNPRLFTQPEAARVGVIALESEQDAEAVLQQVRSGTDFATLARQRSMDPGTAQVGGELGWVIKGRLDPAIEAVAFSLRVGEAGVAKNDRASFVVKLEDRRPARLQEFALAREKAGELLLDQRRRVEVNRWITRLREGSEIVIDDEAINQAVAMYEDQVRKKAAAKAPQPGGASGESE
jgi:parvulin-like peptidyl-prolyl isomerase